MLSPTVFDCLCWLLEHRDRAVGRDELAAAVWGRADFADTQVVQAVLKARRAVADTGEEQRAIRTIPRFGYRWVAPVAVETPRDAGEDAVPLPRAPLAAADPVDVAAAAGIPRPFPGARAAWRPCSG